MMNNTDKLFTKQIMNNVYREPYGYSVRIGDTRIDCMEHGY